MKRHVGLRRTGFARRVPHPTGDAERALLARLRAAYPAAGFRHRLPVGRLSADFGSHDARVIVEIDGTARDAGEAHARSAAFEAAGYLVLRFSEDDVTADIDRVVAEIAQAMAVWNG